MIALYGHAQGLAGNAAEARATLHALEQLQTKRFVPSFYLAGIQLGLGETKNALDLLDEAYQQRIDRLVYLGVDPMADSLRSNPRFQDLLHRVGLASPYRRSIFLGQSSRGQRPEAGRLPPLPGPCGQRALCSTAPRSTHGEEN